MHGLERSQLAHDASSTGLGIAFVSAVHAKVPVLLYDKSPAQIKSGLGLMDKILAKDVSKGKLTSEAAKEARDRVSVVDELKHFQGADLVIEVCVVFMCVRLQALENALPQACSATLPCVRACVSDAIYALCLSLGALERDLEGSLPVHMCLETQSQSHESRRVEVDSGRHLSYGPTTCPGMYACNHFSS